MAPTSARTIAVVLCWNDAPRVRALASDLVRTRSQPHAVVVVDNGSDTDTEHLLRDSPSAPVVLRLGANRGFAAAANAGMRRALDLGADFIWLLNTDVVLPDDALASLVAEASRDARCGMAGAVLLDADGAVQARGGGRISVRTGMARHVRTATERCDYLSGACVLLRASMLRDIGLFDERYVFSWEDVDLGRRAIDAGWTLRIADDCRVVHDEGSTLGTWSRERWYHLFRGMMVHLSDRAPHPRVAVAARLAHHVVTMLRHGRLAPIAGACRAVVAELGCRSWRAPHSRTAALRKI
jgi:GT2 family glycosyltransferase